MMPEISFDPEWASPADWARMYRQAGLQVVPARFPMKTRDDKRPALADWREFQREQVDEAIFGKWFPADAKPNMGAITGAASGNLLVIDLDEYKSPEAALWFDQAMFGITPETWMQQTGGGGRQWFFRLPEGVTIGNCRTALGVDIRGQGGFSMLPPSRHMSGNSYAWSDGHEPWCIDLDTAPQHLIDAVCALIEEHGGTTTPAARERVAAEQDHDAWGHLVDGREEYMRSVVWARVVDLKREHATPPTGEALEAEIAEAYQVYERKVRSRLSGPDLLAIKLEREGRGFTAFADKFRQALRQWDAKVAEAALVPKLVEYEGTSKSTQVVSSGEASRPLILTPNDFVAGFTPPSYLIDGMLQRGYLYSLTAATGHGKTAVAMYLGQCVARGVPVYDREVEQGSVLFCAGENPDDIRARFLMLAAKWRFDPAKLPFYFINGIIDIEQSLPRIREEAEKIPNLRLVIVDTAAAYFKGDDGNNNVQQGAYARVLRQLSFLPGLPSVLVPSHPVKNAQKDNLLPVGGGAFLNEVDGNLTLWKTSDDTTEMHWQGKFRGPEFEPVSFKLETISSETVKDAKGRLMPSVIARPVGTMEQEMAEQKSDSEELTVLGILYKYPGKPLRQIATLAGWHEKSGAPSGNKVRRILQRLKADKLVTEARKRYRITPAGKREIGAADDEN